MVKYIGPAPSDPSDLVTKSYVDLNAIKDYPTFASLNSAQAGDFGYLEFTDGTPIDLDLETGSAFVNTAMAGGSNLVQHLSVIWTDANGSYQQVTYYERFKTSGVWDTSWTPIIQHFPGVPTAGSGLRVLLWDVDLQELNWVTLDKILPPGGGQGAFLVKTSPTDGDIEWTATPPATGTVMLSYTAGVWAWYNVSSTAATAGTIARRNTTGGTIFTGTPTDPAHAATKAYVDTADGTKLDTSAAPELIRDTIAAALVAGTNVTITPNDAGDTITIAATGGGGGTTDYTALTNVPTVILPTNGTTDIAPLIQAAYDAGAAAVWMQPKTTYTWNSAVFLDAGNAYRSFVIHGNGSAINLGSGLPTTNWTRDNTTRFAIFPNTLRSALSGGVVTVNDANRATGSSGQLKGMEVYNLTINGQGDNNRAFAYANRATCIFHTVTAYQLRVCHTWHSYTDGNCYEYCYNRGVSGVSDTSWFVEGYQQGDGIVITSPKSDAGTGFAKLDTSRGVTITGGLAVMDFTDCVGVTITGQHQEGQIANTPSMIMRNSNVTIVGSVIYECWDPAVPAIEIIDSGDSGSELTLDTVTSVSLYQTESITATFGPIVGITSFANNTRVIFRDVRGMVASSAHAGYLVDHRQPYITGATEITNALTSAKGRAARALGSFKLYRTATSTWDIDTIGPQVFHSKRQANAAIGQVTVSTSVPSGGTLTNGQLYEYAVAAMDSLGNYGQVSAAVSATANTNGATRIRFDTPDPGTTLVVWRKAGTGVLTAPTEYCIISMRSPRAFLLDTGVNLSGLLWLNTSVPIPNTVAATNSTVAAVSVNGTQVVTSIPGVPTYISATEPTATGPLLWIKDLGSGNYAIAVKVP